MSGYYVCIDTGSVQTKVALVDDDGNFVSIATAPVHVHVDPDDEFLSEIDAGEIWEFIEATLQRWREQGYTYQIQGVTFTAQRIAVIFTDARGEVLYAGSNMDLRGLMYQDEIEDEIDLEEMYQITARNPPLVFSLARLLWFREEDEETYERIAHVFSLDAWMAYQFSGVPVASVANSVDTQCMDVRTMEWSEKVVSAFELDPGILPPLEFPGRVVGPVSPALAERFGLPADAQVVCGTGDSQSALVGMGVRAPDEVGIISGTTTPTMWVVDAPVLDPAERLWCNPYEEGKWLVEANTSVTGRIFKWFVETFFDADAKSAYAALDAAVLAGLDAESEVFAFLGPDLMDFGERTDIKPGMFIFPSPGSPIDPELPRAAFGRAVLENIAFGIKLNFDELLRVTGRAPKRVVLSGGLGQSRAFRTILAHVLEQPVAVPKQFESSLVGCYLLLRRALDPDFDVNAVLETEGFYDEVALDPEVTKRVQANYKRWRAFKEKVWDAA